MALGPNGESPFPPGENPPYVDWPAVTVIDHSGYEVMETEDGGELDVPAEDGVLTGSANAHNDPWTSLSVSVVEAPHHGSVTLSSDGSFTYIPDTGFAGEDFFRFVASHQRQKCDCGAEGEATEQDTSLPATAYVNVLNFKYTVKPTVKRDYSHIGNRPVEPITLGKEIAELEALIKRVNDFHMIYPAYPNVNWAAALFPIAGIAGFLIGVRGGPVVNRTTQTANFGTVTVTLVPYTIVHRDDGLQKLNFEGDIIDGPPSTQEHERWHVEGMPPDLQARVQQRLAPVKPTTGLGFIKGFNTEMARIAAELGPLNTGIPDDGFPLLQKLLKKIEGSTKPIVNAGEWHDPPTKAPAKYDVLIK